MLKKLQDIILRKGLLHGKLTTENNRAKIFLSFKVIQVQEQKIWLRNHRIIFYCNILT